MSNINDKRKVKVQQRSGFDKSYRSTLTGDCGTLIPILVDELMPDTKPNLRINLATALPPLVSDTYMNVRVRVEAFIVPHRLCQANFDDFFSDYPVEVGSNISDPSASREFKGCMPLIRLVNSNSDYNVWLRARVGAGSLCDYMGFEPSSPAGGNRDSVVAPFVAYHLIWQEWYRNPRVQKPAFRPSSVMSYVVSGNSEISASCVPFGRYYFGDDGGQPIVSRGTRVTTEGEQTNYLLADGTNILSLRQRNFGLDFFTSAMVEPQQGDVAVVKFGENGDPADGFSIASLRAMNSIQQFRERNGLTSPRYQQQLYARYGVAPSDGVIQRPVLVGSASYDVYSHGVTSNSSTNAPAESANPFAGSLGQRAGNGFAGGSDFLISDFHVKEPCYLIVLASLVPEVSYSQNLNPIFNRYIGLGSITDMANALLQNVGPEPIEIRQLYASAQNYGVFAYTDRYATWMYRNNEIHGEFKHGRTLQSFVLQRFFVGPPEFGSEFLTIPKDYLDDVLSVTSKTLGFSYWMDILFEYKVSQPLQEYAIPSLQDPAYEHGETIVLRKNGQLL